MKFNFKFPPVPPYPNDFTAAVLPREKENDGMSTLTTRAAALVLALAGAHGAAIAPVASFVHAHSSSRRAASWTRTHCGWVGNTSSDQISQWGAALDPNAVLQEYPRPQMARAENTSIILNGLWEMQLARGHVEGINGVFDDPVPFGATLNQTILVPFPLESCLSGAFAWPLYSRFLYYRVLFDAPAGPTVLLHFGAVDWNSTVYLNGATLGNHLGGYDGFSYDLTASGALKPTDNELVVAVFDPSNTGVQPHGKQVIGDIAHPGGDTYTPSSGIWQTVWLESVPTFHISALKVRGDAAGNVFVTASTAPNVPGLLTVTVSLQGATVATATGDSFTELVVPVPAPQLWSATSPTLYDLAIAVAEPSTGNSDAVTSYVGLRTVSLVTAPVPAQPGSGARVGYDNSGGDLPNMPIKLNASDYNLCWALCNATSACVAWSYGVPGSGCEGSPLCWLKGSSEAWSQNQCRIAGDQPTPAGNALRPAINGEPVFIAGWLDQSWWSDGEYTAPSDAALAFDVTSIKAFGMNGVRLHQKVNSERWYYAADVAGVYVLQDAVQKYGGATADTKEPYLADLKAMIDGRGNHPSIIQWEVFNEGDCVGVFENVSEVIAWTKAYDPHRLVDTNSGGPGNDLHVGDVNDIHSYPWPGNPTPSLTQYAMVGEFGGLGAFIAGHEWAPHQCGTYLPTPTPADEAGVYVNMTLQLLKYKAAGVSVSIYTQVRPAPRIKCLCGQTPHATLATRRSRTSRTSAMAS